MRRSSWRQGLLLMVSALVNTFRVLQFVRGLRVSRRWTRMIRILGVDPGLRLTGWGVITMDGPRLGLDRPWRHLARSGGRPGRPPGHAGRRIARRDPRPRAGRGGGRGDLRQHQSEIDAAAGTGARRGAGDAGGGAAQGGGVRGAQGEAVDRRLRRRGQERRSPSWCAGCFRRRARFRRTRPMRWRSRSAARIIGRSPQQRLKA